MENILEIIVPIIFVAIYFLGNLFSGKSEEDERAPTLSPRNRDAEDSDADASERQRRIQEEIRRKIMERRRASEGGESTPTAPSGEQLRQRREKVDARRQAREQEAAREEPPAYSAPSHEMHAEPEPAVFSWDESASAYDDTMQARLKRIEETKRQAEKLRRQAAERENATDEKIKRREHRTGGYFTGTVRDTLQDPRAARVAFIYGEVLGRPVSLRKGESSVPGLN
jgi:hypothetical protein